MLEFRIAEGCGPTARVLQNLVGLGTSPQRGVVCWGRGTQERAISALNAQAGRADKLQQLRAFQTSDILVPPYWEQPPTAVTDYPILGRALRHHGGRDISLILQPADATLFRSDFYTRYIPRQSEFRVWSYRRRHLGTYQKVLANPARYRRIGANWRNGFRFELLGSDEVPQGLREIGARAVEALGLDFGATDVLQGIDGAYYVLEVNTAPGVEGEDRQVIRALAQKIRRWEELGFPRRNGARDE
jgi:hypothetical protein